jgi:hypothetical protein
MYNEEPVMENLKKDTLFYDHSVNQII